MSLMHSHAGRLRDPPYGCRVLQVFVLFLFYRSFAYVFGELRAGLLIIRRRLGRGRRSLLRLSKRVDRGNAQQQQPAQHHCSDEVARLHCPPTRLAACTGRRTIRTISTASRSASVWSFTIACCLSCSIPARAALTCSCARARACPAASARNCVAC